MYIQYHMQYTASSRYLSIMSIMISGCYKYESHHNLVKARIVIFFHCTKNLEYLDLSGHEIAFISLFKTRLLSHFTSIAFKNVALFD